MGIEEPSLLYIYNLYSSLSLLPEDLPTTYHVSPCVDVERGQRGERRKVLPPAHREALTQGEREVLEVVEHGYALHTGQADAFRPEGCEPLQASKHAHRNRDNMLDAMRPSI